MADCKIGIVGLTGKWSTEVLADTVAEKTGFRLVIDMNKVMLNLQTQELLYESHNLCDLDAIIIKKITQKYCSNTLDRLELLRIAENAGVKIFSRPGNIQRLIDRLSCTVSLSMADIPMPETRVLEDIDEAVETVLEFESAILKPLYSTKARGMCLVDKDDGMANIRQSVETFKANNPMMYIQRKLELGGRDLGLMFLNGRYLGAYARITEKDAWNTTINSGGRYAQAEPDEHIVQMAHKAQQLFDMSFTTVDVAETEHGPVVFEVSAFGGFRGAKEGIGMNVAELYVDHVLDSLSTAHNG